MLTTLHSAALAFARAEPLTVEVNISRGIKFHLVGLPTPAVRESQQRLYTALKNLGFRWPGQRITVNLSAGATKRATTDVELPMALGILASSGQCDVSLFPHFLVGGELGLDGTLRPVVDAYNFMSLAVELGFRGVVLNDSEGLGAHFTAPRPLQVVSVRHLNEAVAFFDRGILPDRQQTQPKHIDPVGLKMSGERPQLCFAEVAGQRPLKRALEVAAAGGHHLLISGPPGTGKSLLAERFGTILPPMNSDLRRWSARLLSSLGQSAQPSLHGERPFLRAGTHLSAKQLFGPSSEALQKVYYAIDREPGVLHELDELPAPGLYLKALGGALFIDELANLPTGIRDGLLHFLDKHHTSVLACTNPCACGNFGHASLSCTCSPVGLERYQQRISGPLLDRFDMRLEAQPEPWLKDTSEETSAEIQRRVTLAWERQMERQGQQNAELEPNKLEAMLQLSRNNWRLLYQLIAKEKLSTRGHHRLMAVARTLADLDGMSRVEEQHLRGALAYRKPELVTRTQVSLKKGASKNLGQRRTITIAGMTLRPPRSNDAS